MTAEIEEANYKTTIEELVTAATHMKLTDENASITVEQVNDLPNYTKELIPAISTYFSWEMDHKILFDNLLYAYYTLMSIHSPIYIGTTHAADTYIMIRELLELLPVLEKFKK